MTYNFGDSFDLYAALADANGYWDLANTSAFVIGAGRFSGSRGITANNTGVWLTKVSGANDAVHHFVVCV